MANGGIVDDNKVDSRGDIAYSIIETKTGNVIFKIN